MSRADLLGKFIWHELMTPNAQAAADFYSNVLPWTNEASTVPGYTLCMNGPVGVAGLMSPPEAVRESAAPPSWLVYIAVPDVDAIVEAAQRLGGKTLKAPTDIPGIGRFAVLSDAQGAAFAVFTPPAGAPAETPRPPVGQFSWHELATIDPQGALAFYAELFGWTRGPVHDMGTGGVYQIIERAGVQIGGVHGLQDPSKPPHWLSYVRIESLEEAIAAVKAHGGHVLREPHVVPGGDRVSHVVDPQGGIIALHETPQAAPAAEPRPDAVRRRAAAHKRTAAQPAATRRAPARAKRPAGRTAKPSAKRPAGRTAKPSAKRPAGRTAKPSAKRPARRTAKPSAKRPAGRTAKPSAKRPARRTAKPSAKRRVSAIAKRTVKPAARRTATRGNRRAPALNTAAVKRPARKTRAAARVRPRHAAKRTTRRTARRR